MPPVLHCIRHAQGYHNLSSANHSIHDPNLTPYGEEQCKQVAKNFPFHSSITLIVASPMRRTLYTALYCFPEELKRGLVIRALPEAQEWGDVPCDTGSEPEELQKEFASKPIDLSLVKKGWNIKKGKWATDSASLRARAKEVRQWIKARPEKEIMLVTHGGELLRRPYDYCSSDPAAFLHYINQDWSDFEPAKCMYKFPCAQGGRPLNKV